MLWALQPRQELKLNSLLEIILVLRVLQVPYYYLAEYYYNLGDIPKAVLNYNRVRTEFSGSPLAQTTQAKAVAFSL